MRLIDADALMKAMYHRAFETDGDTMWQSGCWVRYRAIEQTVKAQPTIEPMRWISAFDKSPDKDGEYLTVIKDHEGLFVEITEFMKDRWVVMCGNDDDYHEVSNVIAWMPIPAVVYERGAE